MKTTHCQCVLEKLVHCHAGGSYSKQTAWLPKRYAVIGEFLELKDDDGNWTDGWQVTAVGVTKETEEVVERSADYRKTRRATDI